MKTLRYTLITLASLLGLTCCTHNEGDIGIWFGTWQVERAILSGIDGSYDYQPVDASLYFQFQGEMVTVRWVSDLHDEVVDYGTWSENDDGTLDISFPDDNVAYNHILASLLGNPQATYHFVIDRKTANQVIMVYALSDGEHLWALHLRKN